MQSSAKPHRPEQATIAELRIGSSWILRVSTFPALDPIGRGARCAP